MAIQKRPGTPSKPRTIQPEPLQFDFFATDDRGYSKALGLWDMAPYTVLYTSQEDRESGRFLRSIDRTFEAGGRVYKLTLRPARIRHEDGRETDEYPGEREHLVELAIRRIATIHRDMSLDSDEVVSVTVGLYQIYNELQSNGHWYRYEEIEEALSILNKAQVEISRLDTDADGEEVENILSEPIFPTLRYRRNTNKDRVAGNTARIRLNSLMADAIKRLDLHDVDYGLLMSLKPIPRWVYKRLHYLVLFSRDVTQREFQIRASEIQQISGMGTYSRARDAWEKITEYMSDLVSSGIADEVTPEPVLERSAKRGRPKRVDIIYNIKLSSWFMDTCARARRRMIRDREDFVAVVGRQPQEGWHRPKPATRKKLMERKEVRKEGDLPLLRDVDDVAEDEDGGTICATRREDG
jgi:hypothetical protein